MADSTYMGGQGTVVFFDREDVVKRPLLSARTECIALSPSASAAAESFDISACRDASSFSNMDHARCVATSRRAVRQIWPAMETAGISDSLALIASQAIWGHANLVERLCRTLSKGPWLIRDRKGVWAIANDWRALYEILLPRIWNYGLAHTIVNHRPYFSPLLKYLVRSIARKSRRERKPWVVAPSNKLKNGLTGALINAGANIAVLQPTAGGWKDYSALLRNLRSSSRIRNFPVAPLANKDPSVLASLKLLKEFGDAISNDRVRFAWNLYQPYFANALPSMLAITGEGNTIIRALQPRATVGYEANSWLSAALLEASGTASVKRIIFNHNSQPPTFSPIADNVLRMLFQHRTCNTLTDIAAIWSPASMRWLQAPDSMHTKSSATPVRLKYPVVSRVRQPNEPLRVLHAGNYQNWSDFFPWVAETAHEYLNGVEVLADEISLLENIELTIRVRPKREVDAKTVAEKLGNRRNVRVCGIEQDFLKQLADHDLLVAHFSTTLEQALQMGKPILLWGSADRYEQFSAYSKPPSGTLSNSVYVARTQDALGPMLRAIRDAQPTDAGAAQCLQSYGFDADVPDLSHLANTIIAEQKGQL